MFKQLNRPAVWSNLFYAVPFIAAGARGLWLTSASVAALFIFSFAFHYSRERKFIIADIFAAGVVGALCIALLLSGGLRSGYALIALLLVIVGLYIRFRLERSKRGGALHGLWHMVAAVLILACVLSYGA